MFLYNVNTSRGLSEIENHAKWSNHNIVLCCKTPGMSVNSPRAGRCPPRRPTLRSSHARRRRGPLETSALVELICFPREGLEREIWEDQASLAAKCYWSKWYYWKLVKIGEYSEVKFEGRKHYACNSVAQTRAMWTSGEDLPNKITNAPPVFISITSYPFPYAGVWKTSNVSTIKMKLWNT